MPNGRTHSIATIMLAAGIGIAAHYNGWPVFPLAGGALAGLVLTPDLDVAGGSISNRWVRQTTGNIFGTAWRLFWMPYSRLFHHRSFWTHFPVISTIIRLIYFIGIPLLIIYLVKGFWYSPQLPGWWQWPLIGLMTSDAVHWIMDQTMRGG